MAGSEVAVVIDLPTLLRMADDPGDMPGCGPVAAEIVRQLAADAKWRAWLTDTVGGPWFDVDKATRAFGIVAAPPAHHAVLLGLSREAATG